MFNSYVDITRGYIYYEVCQHELHLRSTKTTTATSGPGISFQVSGFKEVMVGTTMVRWSCFLFICFKNASSHPQWQFEQKRWRKSQCQSFLKQFFGSFENLCDFGKSGMFRIIPETSEGWSKTSCSPTNNRASKWLLKRDTTSRSWRFSWSLLSLDIFGIQRSCGSMNFHGDPHDTSVTRSHCQFCYTTTIVAIITIMNITSYDLKLHHSSIVVYIYI